MKKINHTYRQVNPIRIYLLLIIFLGLGSIVSADYDFVGINIGSMDQKFSEVVFKANGNDQAGAIFWLNTKDLGTGEVITINGESKTCFKQIKGIYYNGQQGERIRPLDEVTLSYFRLSSNTYDDLSMSGGLYTSCSGDEYSIYGQVTYQIAGNSEPKYITAGVQYNWGSNEISGAFAKSLQRVDNKYPIGYIYDNVGGGIGFVGGIGEADEHLALINQLNQGSGINELFRFDSTNNEIINSDLGLTISTSKGNAINTLMNAGIQGTIGLSFSINTIERNTILGNFNRKTLIFNALNVNFSKLINQVRKNTENLCKGKYESAAPNDFSSKDIFCLENVNVNIAASNNDWMNLKNKIIVLRSGDIRINGAMGINDGPVSIFIDKGNLLINKDNNTMVDFNENGYPANPLGVTKGVYLKGNFIINGLIVGANAGRNKIGFDHKLFLNGKFASLNTPNYPSLGRIDQIRTIFRNDTNNNWIRLGNVFTRECNPMTGSGSDGSPCNNQFDKNALLPLIIIDGNYPSKILQ